MQRYGRVLKLRVGAEADYVRLHAAVWPEVLAAIRDSGIQKYSIFRYHQWLFAYIEIPDGASLESIGIFLASQPACIKWETLMHGFQEALPESGKDNWWVPMNEIFVLPN